MSETHDYRESKRVWGHDIGYSVLPNDHLKAYGWGDGLAKGDYILLSNGSGDTRYRIKKISYRSDPGDMWFAMLVFAPRRAEARA